MSVRDDEFRDPNAGRHPLTPPLPSPPAAKLLDAQEAMLDVVATYTGLKARFMAEGWSEEGAEGMVVAIARSGGR